MTVLHSMSGVALSTVAAASRVARAVQRDLDVVRRITKDDRSPVTVADFAVQAIIAMDLAEADPAVMIVGEENADLLREPEQSLVLDAVVDAVRTVRPDVTPDDVLAAIDRCDHDGSGAAYWALDPIDGTKGFLRGQQYAIALGRIEDGRVTLGVMGCPNLPDDHGAALDVADPTGVIYVAALDEGAWGVPADDPAAAPKRIEATPFDGDRPVRVCESVESAHTKHSDAARIVESIGATKDSVRLDSQCKYAVVGRGQADAYLRLPTKKGYVEKIWDHAAGSIIATEGGAVVSDITGSPLDFTHGRQLETNRGVVCASRSLHGRVIEAIDRLGLGAAV